jgi:methionyl-tRNA formyltransferase
MIELVVVRCQMGPRLVFMGTPSFAVPSLEALVGNYEIVAVVTQPDRPASRGRKTIASPVKEVALADGLPLMQPQSLRQEDVIAQIRELEPQVIVVAAYGQMLRPEVLSIPPSGVINVHPSVLPQYRGASPIAGALLAGEEETGVTIMLMDEGMDSGPILAQISTRIRPEDTRGSLGEQLSRLGAELLLETLPPWLGGHIEPQPQDSARATYTRLITKEEGIIDWSLPAVEIWHRVRAFEPWPGTRTWWRGKTLGILAARPLPEWAARGKPGRVLELSAGVAVATGQGALLLQEVQLAGKRAMDIRDFARGQRDFVGSLLGEGALD